MWQFYKSIVNKAFFSKLRAPLIFIAAVVGIYARVIKMLISPIWRDEAYLILSARENSLKNLILQAHWDTNHPPLYFIFMKYFQKLNLSIYFLRAPSVIASCLVLLLLPILANKICRSNKTFPFFLVFYFSLIHSQIFLGIIARPYSFTILLSILSLILFFDLLEQAQKKSSLKFVLFVFVTALSFYVDYSAIWLIMAYWIFFILYWIVSINRQNNNEKKLVKCMFVVSLLCLPAVLSLLIHLGNSSINLSSFQKLFINGNPISNNIYVLNFFSGTTYRDFLSWPIIRLNVIAWSVLKLLLAFLGIISLKNINPRGTILLLLIFIMPVEISFLFSLLFFPIFLAHNLFITNIAFILGISYLTSVIFNKINVVGYIVLVVWLLSFISSYSISLNYSEQPYNWGLLAKVISRGTKETKVLISRDPPFMFVVLKYYNLLWGLHLKYKVISISEGLTYHFDYLKEDVFFIQTSLLYDAVNNIDDYIYASNRLGCKLHNEKAGEFIYLSRCVR